MKWIKTERAVTRGGIEPSSRFVRRNLQWWIDNRRFERYRRKPYYKKFLEFGNITPYIHSDIVLGEVGAGPFGGIIEVCKLPARHKVFIDYIMDELFNLRLIVWPDNATYVDAPAESIPLQDNSIDVLLSFNALDHGWDIYACLNECIRVGKKCFLSFDCRGDDENEVVIRRDEKDKDHYQLLRYENILNFMKENYNDGSVLWTLDDMGLKNFPVVFLQTEKQ